MAAPQHGLTGFDTADLLNTWQASVIKGNAGELAAIADSAEVSIALTTA